MIKPIPPRTVSPPLTGHETSDQLQYNDDQDDDDQNADYQVYGPAAHALTSFPLSRRKTHTRSRLAINET